MADLRKVKGAECLQYIEKPIGLASHTDIITGTEPFTDEVNRSRTTISGNMNYRSLTLNRCNRYTTILKWYHDISKRVVGLVTGKSDDGGLQVALLGNNLHIHNSGNSDMLPGDCEFANLRFTISGEQTFTAEALPPFDYYPDKTYNNNPTVGFSGTSDSLPNCWIYKTNQITSDGIATFEEMLDYTPNFDHYTAYGNFGSIAYYGNQIASAQDYTITTDKNNTFEFGHITDFDGVDVEYPDIMCDNPLNLVAGNLYQYCTEVSMQIKGFISPEKIDAGTDFDDIFYLPLAWRIIKNSNLCSIPFNIILTENEREALLYLSSGRLPSDAFLYPLDWNNIPKYKAPDSGDDDDDGNPDGTNPDGNRDRDVDPTPLVTPTIVPTMLNANNIYWLGVGRLGMFFTWFWYDIQQFSLLNPTTWDNIFDNIQGLYNNLASAILSIRYYPVRPEWVGGLGTQSRIKLAQIEQDGAVDTINTFTQPPIEKIGSFNVSKDFDSFLDLAPYSQLVLYLPYYGYVDLDIDIFNGYSLDVYATYDILSGTITYYIYYDDTFMLNTYTAKMSVDIPITLQTQYERDRTIQSNITTALSGFMSAGAGALTGNPIGAVLGVNALQASMSPQNTAPIKVEGMLAEQGMFYAPSKCAVILRRPTTTKKGDSFKRNNGHMWCKTERLDNLSGLTICQNPRITFNGAEYYNDQGQPTGKMLLPLDTEIQEIYELLEKGVIL